MCKLFDIYPKYASRLFEFSCIRKLTSASGSNWHMLCSYNFTTGSWNHLVDGYSFHHRYYQISHFSGGNVGTV